MVRPYLPYGKVENLVNIDFAMAWRWDCKFPDAPSPFNDWFPADTANIDMSGLTSETIRGPTLNTNMPIAADALTIQMSCYDDDKRTLHNWFSEWQDKIICNGTSVLPVKSASRQIIFCDINNQEEHIKTFNYLVYPEGKIVKAFSSESKAQLLNITLNITGRVGGARRAASSSDAATSTSTGDVSNNILSNNLQSDTPQPAIIKDASLKGGGFSSIG